jgi:hypothetical protein
MDRFYNNHGANIARPSAGSMAVAAPVGSVFIVSGANLTPMTPIGE